MPHRTCVGCRVIAPQHELVRVAVDGARVVLDPRRRLAGRGAYVHPRAACVSVGGLARGLRRSVTPGDVQRIVASLSEMSPDRDNPSDGEGERADEQDGDHLRKNAPGLVPAKTVDIPPRLKAKDDWRPLNDARV